MVDNADREAPLSVRQFGLIDADERESTGRHVPGVLAWLVAGCSFAIAHGTERCFASNQHTYLLHAFRLAYPSRLRTDWLAGTTDLTPVFSRFAATLFSIAGRGGLDVAHAVLSAIWLVTLVGIVTRVFPRLRTLVGVVSISAGLAVLDAIPALRHVLLDGMARQMILGPYLQPSALGVFLLIALFFTVSRQPRAAAISSCFAAIMHPTYLFSAGLVCLALVKSSWEKRSHRTSLELALIACAAAALVAVEVWPIVTGADARTEALAETILAVHRAPHHALVRVWLGQRPFAVAIQIAICVAGIVVVLRRERELAWILSLAALVALVLTIVALVSGNLHLALLFPWRVSAWLVPVSTALVLGALFDRWLTGARIHSNAVLSLAAACLAVAAVHGAIQHIQGWHAAAPEPDLIAALRSRTGVDDVLVAPVDLEWIRLDAERAVVADAKSHPFQGDEVVAWWSRLQLVTAVYDETRTLAARRASLARVVMFEPHASWLLLRADDRLVSGMSLPVVWHDAHWALLRVSSSSLSEEPSRAAARIAPAASVHSTAVQ
jgi:hypothetical protein